MRQFMALLFRTVLILLGLSASTSKVYSENNQSAKISWPHLPTTGFVIGRAATKDDLKAGNAIFVTSYSGGAQVGLPSQIAIPQYAYFHSQDTLIPVIVMQAEFAPDGSILLGAKKLDGSDLVGLAVEFELLGISLPTK